MLAGAILRRIAEDRTSKEIADELGISYRIVVNHRSYHLTFKAFQNDSNLADFKPEKGPLDARSTPMILSRNDAVFLPSNSC